MRPGDFTHPWKCQVGLQGQNSLRMLIPPFRPLPIPNWFPQLPFENGPAVPTSHLSTHSSMMFHNYSSSFSAREQLRVYILTWSHIIICSSKPINQEDLRVTPLSLSVLLIFESLVLISWTSWFLLQGFLPLAPAPEERMRQLEHQSPLRRACFHKMEQITNNNSSPETASPLQLSTPRLRPTLTLRPQLPPPLAWCIIWGVGYEQWVFYRLPLF